MIDIIVVIIIIIIIIITIIIISITIIIIKHYQQEIWNIWKAQWKHPYLKFWFAGIGLHQQQTRIVTLMQLSSVVVDEKCN